MIATARALPAIAALACAVLAPAPGAAETVVDTALHRVRAVTLVEGLDHPWSLAFLPDGRALVTERAGRLRLLGPDFTLDPRPVDGLPAHLGAVGQGGLHDVVPHPDFARNRLVYLAFAGLDADRAAGTEVARARLDGHRLVDVEVIFRALPKSYGGRHFGGRLLFLPDATLLIALGDRGDKDRAQDLGDHAGSIIRVRDDGSVPPDNPFTATPGALPEIWTYGNRNVQGIALEPRTGRVWAHEHGPQGGDEVNVIVPGTNYGWPVITYGVNYGFGTQIGEGTHKDGMAQPVLQWTPSIAPSGMAFYDGDRFPRWRGRLLVGALKYELVSILDVRELTVRGEERILADRLGRIRDVRTGPDGYVYLLTDEDDGALVRLEPAD